MDYLPHSFSYSVGHCLHMNQRMLFGTSIKDGYVFSRHVTIHYVGNREL